MTLLVTVTATVTRVLFSFSKSKDLSGSHFKQKLSNIVWFVFFPMIFLFGMPFIL